MFITRAHLRLKGADVGLQLPVVRLLVRGPLGDGTPVLAQGRERLGSMYNKLVPSRSSSQTFPP
eukprot:7763305-Pyramimonas_sp.AAC.1